MLGITSIDPSATTCCSSASSAQERREPPDIDVDFEHERREEVIQWIYDTYGRDRAALVRDRDPLPRPGAVRDVGKALGLPEDVTGALAGQVWGWSDGRRRAEARGRAEPQSRRPPPAPDAGAGPRS